jgi:AcrR family transcriptional regulator
MVNSSPAMYERRRRILREARRLIGEGRPGGFSMRELSDRAKVAPNTIYNAFGGKEALLAITVSEYFEEFYEHIIFQHDAVTLDGVLERELATTMRNLEIAPYIAAVTDLYFSRSGETGVRKVLTEIAMKPYAPWLARLREEAHLERGVAFDRIASSLATLLYGQALEWTLQLLGDDAFVSARLDAVLTYLGGVTRGRARSELRALFTDLHGRQVRIGPAIAAARERVRSAHERSRNDHPS